MKMINNFNYISSGICGLILSESKVANRRKVMWKLVSVCQVHHFTIAFPSPTFDPHISIGTAEAQQLQLSDGFFICLQQLRDQSSEMDQGKAASFC